MTKQYQICQRCIMDTSDPEIRFDEKGICNHCKSYYRRLKNEVPKGQARVRELENIVSTIREAGKGKEYDCLIGVSGGVDSTTVAYWINNLGLRPLAVHFDNGWNSELAVDNIKRSLDILKIDLHTHVVEWEEFRDLQLSILRASVPNCEIPTDHGINALMFNTAEQYGIKYLIGGGNVATEGIMPNSWGYYNQDLKHLLAIHSQFGTVPLQTMPTLSLWKYMYLVLVKKFRIIPILNYLEYDKLQAMELIQRELGWRPYPSKHFESVFTRFFQGYILPTKFGYDKRRAHFSCLICAGSMTRQQALEEMKSPPYSGDLLRWDRDFVLKKLRLSEEQFSEIMQLPVKSEMDYPSDKFLLDGLAKLRKVFKKIATRI